MCTQPLTQVFKYDVRTNPTHVLVMYAQIRHICDICIRKFNTKKVKVVAG